MLKTILSIVLAAAAIAVALGVSPATAHDPSHDIAVRDQLIRQQEDLLNVYRCMFDIDTQLVPGGCADPASAPTAQPQAVSHWHCQRVINDGSRCDRRFRPERCWHSHAADSNHTWRSHTVTC